MTHKQHSQIQYYMRNQVGATDYEYEVTPWAVVWSVASTVSAGACAYHGYKRNDSVGWAIGWALLGGIFPEIAPAIAIAQGFGEKKK